MNKSESKYFNTAKKMDKALTRGMTKREIEAAHKALDKMLYNISEP